MVDFVLLCREQHIPYLESGHHHCADGWIQVHCPFCGDGSHGWHLGFSTEYGNMNCWRCGKHTVKDWLYQIAPSGARSQIFQILKKYQIQGYKLIKEKKAKIRQRNVKAPLGIEKLSSKHKKYLEKRGFDPEKLEKIWELQGTRHLSKEWNWRIVAPIHNVNKRIVAYTGRTLGSETKPRWRTTADNEMAEDPRKLIYGIEKTNTKKGVLVVEGPSDVWRMGPGSVGLLGINWKVEQAAILRHFKRRFIMFDNQKVAQKKAKELADWLSAFPGETEILYDIPLDPGAFSQSDADNIMRELKLK